MAKSKAARGEKIETLAVGSRVFYPGHGVASVIGSEEREFGDSKQVFYVLALVADPGVKLLLPASKVGGVRALVSASKARELMKSVMEEPGPMDTRSDPAARKQRATGYSESLRSGSPDRYTETLRELLSRSRAGKLSAGEQQILNQVLTLFVGEMSVALDREPDDVKEQLRPLTGAGPAPG